MDSDGHSFYVRVGVNRIRNIELAKLVIILGFNIIDHSFLSLFWIFAYQPNQSQVLLK